MKVKGLTCILVFLLGSVGMLRAEPSVTFSLKAMQMNIWKGGSMVEGAVGMIADEIIHSDADLIFLNELRNFQGENFILYMVKELRRRGYIYYGEKSYSEKPQMIKMHDYIGVDFWSQMSWNRDIANLQIASGPIVSFAN